jgi:flagellum-specific peptidoglycan hydrolase FlgJ
MLRQSLTLLLGLVVALLAVTHSASAQEASKASKEAPKDTKEAPKASKEAPKASKASKEAPKASKASQGVCPPPDRVLEGVWSPDRLIVVNPCQTITGKIDASKLPQYLSDDGDIHNEFAVDKQYRKLLTDQQETYGTMVVELMPRDGGHLPVLPVGPKLTLWGALVYDSWHAWMEIHPVFGYCVEGGSCYTSGPQFGGTPRESTGNPREECFTETGRICRGYEGQVPTYDEVKGNGSSP